MFNSSEFFSAFARHGLLVDVTHTSAEGAVVTFKAGFKRPGELLLSENVVSDEYALEIEVVTAPAMAEGDQVSIAGVVYSLRTAPRRTGDGAFAVVNLSRIGE